MKVLNWCIKVHDMLKQLQSFANLYGQKLGAYVCKWIVKVLDQGGWNLLLEQAQFIHVVQWPEVI